MCMFCRRQMNATMIDRIKDELPIVETGSLNSSAFGLFNSAVTQATMNLSADSLMQSASFAITFGKSLPMPSQDAFEFLPMANNFSTDMAASMMRIAPLDATDTAALPLSDESSNADGLADAMVPFFDDWYL